MTVRLHIPHLPHPHIAVRLLERLHRPPLVEATPEAVAAWAEWATPDEWEAQHSGRGER